MADGASGGETSLASELREGSNASPASPSERANSAERTQDEHTPASRLEIHKATRKSSVPTTPRPTCAFGGRITRRGCRRCELAQLGIVTLRQPGATRFGRKRQKRVAVGRESQLATAKLRDSRGCFRIGQSSASRPVEEQTMIRTVQTVLQNIRAISPAARSQ